MRLILFPGSYSGKSKKGDHNVPLWSLLWVYKGQPRAPNKEKRKEMDRREKKKPKISFPETVLASRLRYIA